MPVSPSSPPGASPASSQPTRSLPQTEVQRFLNAWFAVRQMIQAANFNRFQGEGLSATQFMTLNLLPADGAGIAIGELARRMNLKAATVAKTVDSLEARSFVTRIRSTIDKRSIHVKATRAGLELQNSASSHFRNYIEQLFEALTPREREALVNGLESLVRSGGGLSGNPRLTDEADASPPARRSSRRSPQA